MAEELEKNSRKSARLENRVKYFEPNHENDVRKRLRKILYTESNIEGNTSTLLHTILTSLTPGVLAESIGFRTTK